MDKVIVKCTYCKKEFQRERGRHNEAIKKGWNQYCSQECQRKSKVTRVEKVCGNPKCNRKVSRVLHEFKRSESGLIFCSRSCSAAVSNSKRKKIRTCLACGKKFLAHRKYCSKSCRPNTLKGKVLVTKHQILKEIKRFCEKNGRIPVKIEFSSYHAAQNRFGSWNNAIKAAGFNPNPVRFAKKYIANDGHKCDSLSEKIIDDWLYARDIPHEINVPYGKNRMTADFKVNDILIEFLGLQGELKEYDRTLSEKERLWQRKNLKVIKIYPRDLFPENKLDKLLTFN